jgi:gag-polyprotein putative aspartyl protease
MEQRAFTSRANGLVREIKTKAGIFTVANSLTVVPENMATFEALWDTGATNTAIASSVVKQLGLKPITFTKVGTGGGEVLAPVHLINIVLPNNVIIPSIQVTELKDLNNCDILLGMDVICQGDFAITHKDGQACFTFRMPPAVHIDFVPESNAHNMRLQSRVNQSTKQKPKRKPRKKR